MVYRSFEATRLALNAQGHGFVWRQGLTLGYPGAEVWNRGEVVCGTLDPKPSLV